MASTKHSPSASVDLITDGSSSSDSLDSLLQRKPVFGLSVAMKVFGVVIAVSGACVVILAMTRSEYMRRALKPQSAVQYYKHLDTPRSIGLEAATSSNVQNSPTIPPPSTQGEILKGPWKDAAQTYMSIHKLSRGERLVRGGVRHVYHQTSMDACKAILTTGFRTGINGIIGNGMYFAEKSIETGRKTRHYGCMIEVLVRLGRIYNAGEGYGTNPPNRDRLLRMGFDSVTVVDVTHAHFGREFEIYHEDQIVDMFAYPCMARWTNCVNEKTQYKCKTPPTGERTGDNLDGKSGFDLSKLASSADEFRSVPTAADVFTAPDEPIAV